MVFVDTYASWCAPCKVMDRVFDEPEVSKYFNNHFINVKIDMEGPQGNLMLHNYEVVWLPTLLIIDGDGDTKVKIDHLIAGSDLISHAQNAISGSNTIKTSTLNSTPFAKSTEDAQEKDYDPAEKEEVIYVYDEKASSGRPHIMYHEAYLHLQLMDGQHQKVVKKYLSTQEDWTTEKNIKFIFDFLQDVGSTEFEYFINHRPRFEEVLGSEKVAKTLAILVDQRLSTGFPRPDLEEAQSLYRHINPAQAEQMVYKYWLNRLLLEGHYETYIVDANTYLDNINPYDIPVICSLAELKINAGQESDLDKVQNYLVQASFIDEGNPEIHYWLSKLFYIKKDKISASKHIASAMVLIDPASEKLEKYTSLQHQIESML